MVGGMIYSNIDVVKVEVMHSTRGSRGWGFTLWSDLLDDEAPHRDFLTKFSASHPGVELRLPPFDRDEDFVEGSLRWGSRDARIFYETIFSHLDLWAPDREPVEKLRAAMVEVLMGC
jgi:hypothetical protein